MSRDTDVDDSRCAPPAETRTPQTPGPITAAHSTGRPPYERWRESELALLRPRLIVTVGGLAARELLGLERVTDFVGSSYDVADAVAVPLPHPSGASGWLNAPANRARLDDALALVAAALARL
jgi:uracil-DNA glycosylase